MDKKPRLEFSSEKEPANIFDVIYLAQTLINEGGTELYEEISAPENTGIGYAKILDIIRKYVDLVDTNEKY